MYVAPDSHSVQPTEDTADITLLPFKQGERFTYEVRYNGVTVGRSILEFHGETELGDKKVYYISFSTAIPSLKDAEEIYAYEDSFLPLEVRRTIRKTIGFSDRIVEKYDQANFKVDIKQKSTLRSRSFSIEKDSPIQNAILLTYYYRAKKNFDGGERLKVNLPTVSFEIMFSGEETIDTPLGEYRAYAFTSEPPRFKLWLSADEKRIPLKIQNPGTLGYSLVIKSID